MNEASHIFEATESSTNPRLDLQMTSKSCLCVFPSQTEGLWFRTEDATVKRAAFSAAVLIFTSTHSAFDRVAPRK